METAEVCDCCMGPEQWIVAYCTDCDAACCRECFDYDGDEPVCLDCKEDREYDCEPDEDE